MGDMLSQAEIDALLNGSFDDLDSSGEEDSKVLLTNEEKDALGEIGNINMGTSATTLFTLLGQKVVITTPVVEVTTWDKLSQQYTAPVVAVTVEYKEGLLGTNLLLMQQDDVKIITDLMMGGEGKIIEGELSELHMSAISEAMNQMIGSSATSMSSMFDKKVDIGPPQSEIIDFINANTNVPFEKDKEIIKIEFNLVVGDLINSKIMQLLPVEFAKDLVGNLLHTDTPENNVGMGESVSNNQQNAVHSPQPQMEIPQPQMGMPQPQMGMPQPQMQPQMGMQQPQMEFPQPQMGMPQMGQTNMGYQMQAPQGFIQQGMGAGVNVQPVQFDAFDLGIGENEKKNIGILMDVPLQITVELGRTNKKIREILEFGQGSIIELDKLAGEPVDILVNGKNIAKGEVVVIDESFGVRITDIIHPSKRL